MKINEIKQKQLNRIQYLLEKQEVGEYRFITPGLIWDLAILILVFLTFAFLIWHITGEVKVLDAAYTVMSIVKPILWISIIADIIFFFKNREKRKEIDRRFGYEKKPVRRV